MTANTDTVERGKTLTDSVRSTIDKLTEDIRRDVARGRLDGAEAAARRLVREFEVTSTEQQILELMDSEGLDYIDVETAAGNTDTSRSTVVAALESLEMKGELAAEPVVYQRQEQS